MKLPGTPPEHTWFYLTIIAITVLGFTLLEKTRQGTKTIPIDISFENARKIELDWIDKAFPQLDYLLAPISPLPCITKDIPSAIRKKTQKALDAESAGKFHRAKQILNGSNHWLPVLTLAILSTKHHQEQYALQTLEKYLKANWNRLKASRQQSIRSALIHLGYMYGWLRIKTGQYLGNYKLLWDSLKRPIGLSKFFIDSPTTRKQPIPGGCSDAQKLTSYALYNNLIVAYMKTKNFKASRRELNGECRRSASWRESQTPVQKPLLLLLKKLCPSNDIDEYLIWAVSNAERLFAQTPEPPDLLLNINLMLLIDTIIQRGDQTSALLQKRELLRSLSLKNWASAPKEYKTIAASSVVRLAINNLSADIKSYLNEEQLQVLEAISFTTTIREGDSIHWLTKRRDEIKDKLGSRADEWINAVELPFGIAITNWYDNYKWIIMITIILIILIIAYWRAETARERNRLFTSFYKIEAARR